MVENEKPNIKSIIKNIFSVDFILSRKKSFVFFCIIPLIIFLVFELFAIKNKYLLNIYLLSGLSLLIFMKYRFYYFLRYESKSFLK